MAKTSLLDLCEKRTDGYDEVSPALRGVGSGFISNSAKLYMVNNRRVEQEIEKKSSEAKATSVHLIMSTDQVGKLMGLRGGRIRTLQRLSGCKCLVYKPLEDRKDRHCCLLIKGPVDKIAGAIKMATDILGRQLSLFPDSLNIENLDGYSRFTPSK